VCSSDLSYVEEFFSGKGRCSSNALSWSPQFAESVRYTNASLYSAIKNAVTNPSEVSFSPTSGFHHARPSGGSGFCTFSGQVIASLKIYRELGLKGAYLDLDGHFGNSIEDSRYYCKDLNSAVPLDFNINPVGTDEDYLADLGRWLSRLKHAILEGKIDYVVWCHGADSHEHDQLGHQCSTEYWVGCSTLFWRWVKEIDQELGRPLPVACALFGGYRDDDYQSVLSLHTSDFVECFKELLGIDVKYTIEVQPRQNFGHYDGSTRLRSSRKRVDKKGKRR
jgi:acetoin utilization deacetylase AcuC-like enzyme